MLYKSIHEKHHLSIIPYFYKYKLLLSETFPFPNLTLMYSLKWLKTLVTIKWKYKEIFQNAQIIRYLDNIPVSALNFSFLKILKVQVLSHMANFGIPAYVWGILNYKM